MNAGNVVLVDFRGALGIKRRPALVVSSDAYNEARPDVVLAVITSNVDSATGRTDHVLTDWAEAGLKRISAFRSYFGTYDQNDVGVVIGRLSASDWASVIARLRVTFGL